MMPWTTTGPGAIKTWVKGIPSPGAHLRQDTAPDAHGREVTVQRLFWREAGPVALLVLAQHQRAWCSRKRAQAIYTPLHALPSLTTDDGLCLHTLAKLPAHTSVEASEGFVKAILSCARGTQEASRASFSTHS